MGRKNSPPVEDELEAASNESRTRARDLDDSPLDARILELDDEAESPFLRGQKRVPVRRGGLPRKAASRLKVALILILIVGCIAAAGFVLHRYLTQSWRFRIDSSDNIEIFGNNNVSRSQVLDVMASDLDRNVFFVPLQERKKQLEQISWVQSAAVMRLLPNRLRIVIHERTPIAFLEVNSRVELVDAHGVILDPPSNLQIRYSFPVIIGMTEAEPLSTRAARMKIYAQLMRELDAGGAHYSRDLSDVDLSDPDDVKATVTDPHGAVLVHLGASNFLERFKIYVAHVEEWRAQFSTLKSVDLRFEHQVIVNPDSAGDAPAEPASPAAHDSGGAAPAEKPAAEPSATKKPAAQHKSRKHP